MGAEGPELSLAFAAWRTAPADHARRRGHRRSGSQGTRIPPGHPEGYLEGFANIYTEAAQAIIARREGRAVPGGVTYPGIGDGVAGVAFVTACVDSSKRGGTWVKFASYTKQ